MTNTYKFLKRVWTLQQPKLGYYFCLATLKASNKEWEDHFFKWPISKIQVEKFLKDYNTLKYNIYFCPTPFINPQRKKPYVIGSRLLWADLDSVSPSSCINKPQITWKS